MFEAVKLDRNSMKYVHVYLENHIENFDQDNNKLDKVVNKYHLIPCIEEMFKSEDEKSFIRTQLDKGIFYFCNSNPDIYLQGTINN